MTEANTLTDAERLAIRAKLAQARGWTTKLYTAMRLDMWFSPDGEPHAEPPDPFTSAADNRALRKWIANDCDRTVWHVFYNTLASSLGLHPNTLEAAKATMTAPLETITLAAAAALGITAPPPEAAPPPAPPEAPRRE